MQTGLFDYQLYAHDDVREGVPVLPTEAPTPELLDQKPFQDLIRTGSEQGLLLGDWPHWRGYRDMRSRTSHTYDEGVALNIVAGIPAFLEEARYLRDRLA